LDQSTSGINIDQSTSGISAFDSLPTNYIGEVRKIVHLELEFIKSFNSSKHVS